MRGRKAKTARAKKLAGNPGRRRPAKSVATDRGLVEERIRFWTDQVHRSEKDVANSPNSEALAFADKAARQLRAWLDERRRLELGDAGAPDDLDKHLGAH